MFVLLRQKEAYIQFGMEILLYCFDQKYRFFLGREESCLDTTFNVDEYSHELIDVSLDPRELSP